ncbi:Reverse transcriptase domain-containing protein [Aphis craccivora]|uniref:Reverse transcriptase domain-containing protein n=1 Tax=Aphis craccivora TaxID=307492 RepID=A0A6G0Y9I4_APHCR|nr:Reverse transcriptase domain-containing protein [Aphis craccivora]
MFLKKTCVSSDTNIVCNSLKTYYQNVHGLRTKLYTLRCNFILFDSYDIIILTETWLTPDIGNAELGFVGFHIFRFDRNSYSSSSARGGGVLIAVKSNLNASLILNNCLNVEQVFIALTFLKTKFLIGAIYLPPNSCAGVYEQHSQTVEQLVSVYYSCNIIICGDYNMPDIVWSHDNIGLKILGCSTRASALIGDSFSFLNFFQVNSLTNAHDSLLDLVFSNSSELSVYKSSQSLVISDPYHPPLDINYVLERTRDIVTPRTFRDFKNVDYGPINEFLLRTDWVSSELSNRNANDAASFFNSKLLEAIDKFVPFKTLHEHKFPLWVSPEIKSLIFQKNRAHFTFKKSGLPLDYNIFSELRAKCKYLSKSNYRVYIGKTERALSNSPRSFWKYVRDLKQHPEIPVSVRFGDHSSNNPSESANLFSDYFKSVFCSSASNQPQSRSPYSLPFDLRSDCHFSPEDILSTLSTLSNKTSTGPDSISALFLLNCRLSIYIPMFLLFRRSLDESTFPDIWKICYVTPVLKSGDALDVTNYRPISHIAKVFESVVYHCVKRSLNHVLIDEQHGFKPGKSTSTNGVSFLSYSIENIESGSQIDVIVIDFKKAFDRVNHELLIHELERLGLGYPLLGWFKSYNTGRKQFIRVAGVSSCIIDIPSGVPQGGHLSPLLFSLFINSLSQHLNRAKCLLFADDIKLFLKVDSTADQAILQRELNLFSTWVDRLGLVLNLDKCHSITFTKSRSSTNRTYSINGFPLKQVFQIKDLGILYASSLSFNQHIEAIVARALKVLGFIKRNTKHFTSVNCLRSLYLTLVRSIIEYGVVVWHPYLARHQHKLEQVQNRFLSYLAFVSKTDVSPCDYVQLRIIFNIPSLSSRRTDIDVRFLASLLNGTLDAPNLLAEIPFKVPTRGIRNLDQFYVPYHSTAYGFNHPLHRMLRVSNLNVP